MGIVRRVKLATIDFRNNSVTRKRFGGLSLAILALIVLFLISGWFTQFLFFNQSAGKNTFFIDGVNFGANYLAWNKEVLRPIFLDKDDEIIGYYPSSVQHANLHPVSSSAYLAGNISSVPEQWWKMVVLLEDEHRNSWYHINGIDLKFILSIPYRILTNKVRGGSTLEMQLVKTMQRDTDKRGFSKLLRKVRDILHAPAMSFYLTHKNPGQLKKWFAIHAPLMISGDHGLASASYTIFNKSPKDLSLAEQALLAAAVKYHLGATVDTNWDKAKARARMVLGKYYESKKITLDLLTATIAELNALKPLKFDTSFVRTCLLQKYGNSKSKPFIERSLTRLSDRAYQVAWSELIEAEAELNDTLDFDWVSELEMVKLTTSVETNCLLKSKLNKEKKRLFNKISARQKRRGYTNTISQKNRQNGVYLTLAVSDVKGNIVAYYGDPSFSYYHGKTWGQKKYNPMKETRRIASIGKVISAVIAGGEGDQPNTSYFMAKRPKDVGYKPNISRKWFQNWDGELGYVNRNDKRGYLTAREAFAHSNNLAIIDRMFRSKKSIKNQFHQMVNDFGYTTHEDIDGSVSHYEIDIPMGGIFGSARTIHTMFRALSSVLYELNLHGRCSPTIISDLKAIKDIPIISTYNDDICIKIRSYIKNNNAKEFIRSVLSSVVQPRYSGTASRALGKWVEGSNDVDWHIAKTGSSSASEEIYHKRPATINAMVAGALSIKGEAFSYIMQIGPRGDEQDLGPYVYGGEISKLMSPVLENIKERVIK